MIIYEELNKKYGLSPTQQKIVSLVGKTQKVLEIGSSTGYMTRLFLQNDCQVTVIENSKEAFKKVSLLKVKAIDKSIEDSGVISQLDSDYDYIIMADVLEHLVEPEAVLQLLSKISSKKTKLLISLPNVVSWPMRKQIFFKGDFEYQESGPLDQTHLHFYTVKTLPKQLLKNGWKIEEIIGTVTLLPFQQTLGKIPEIGKLFSKVVYPKLAKKFSNLGYYHFLTVAKKA